jgi:hypothetical protein
MFPFKQQILQRFKETLPKDPESVIVQLNSAEYGLTTLENKPTYFSRSKDNLLKKYITNLPKVAQKANIILEVLDARNPRLCID